LAFLPPLCLLLGRENGSLLWSYILSLFLLISFIVVCLSNQLFDHWLIRQVVIFFFLLCW
jgi:hypothetical protein